jgi:hypothetical protein
MCAYDGVSPYTRTNMSMGVENVKITSVETIGMATFITGTGFTEWSQLTVDGDKEDTYFINENTLMILNTDIPDGATVYGTQVADNGTVLGITNTYIYRKK